MLRHLGVLLLVIALATPGQALAQDPPASATAKCRDGTYSTSVSRRGACSNHGGVAEWLVPADATAICRDGTYSFSTSRQGSCSNHGGVAAWLEDTSDPDYVTAMKNDLRNLVTAEEGFFADSVKYTTRIGSLNYSVTAGNTAPRITLTPDGWLATIGNVNTGIRCFIFIGTTTNPPALKEGYPTCTTP